MKRMMIALLALLGAYGMVSPALAHKVIASGYAAGDDIEGEVGFSNGDPAINVIMEITDPTGRKLGEAQTDDQGLFHFTPHEAVPHLFKGDLGAGHIAEFRMEVSELPRSLRGEAPASSSTPEGSPAESGALNSAPLANSAALQKMIAEAVRDEVRPLRHEIAAYKEHNDIQTILGGIGYILGLVGISFYWLARQRLKQN